MKKRKVRKELVQSLTFLLKRDRVKHKIIFSKEGIFCETALSSAGFHDYVTNAMCMLQQGDSRIPVRAYNHVLRDGKLCACTYVPLQKDAEKIINAVC